MEVAKKYSGVQKSGHPGSTPDQREHESRARRKVQRRDRQSRKIAQTPQIGQKSRYQESHEPDVSS
jgi:hypothetical protein